MVDMVRASGLRHDCFVGGGREGGTMARRDLIRLDDLPAATIRALCARAEAMAAAWAARRMPAALAGRRVALVVDDGGWRNTTAFDLGIAAMGGLCAHAPIRLAGRESVPDLAAYLGNWVDAVVVRSPELAAVAALAAAFPGPVINARTRQNHPCETLGDLAFLAARWGGLRPMRVGFVGPAGNILGSWIEAARVLPIELVQVFSSAWHAPGIAATEDMGALDGADVVVTDCWPDGAQGLLPYQVDAAVLDRLRGDAVFLPCPPVTRGQEVSAAAMRHPRCTVVAAKAWLLHAQNALLEWCLAEG
jgi:ornithine carbamoyltransferase